jgi:hypothetical protein
MWKASTGQKISGVIALDPAALAAVMRVTGPVTQPVIGQVDASNVEALVLRAQYKILPTPEVATVDRKTLMLGIGTQVLDKLTSGTTDGKTLVAQLSSASKGNHVRIFSTDPDEQVLLEKTVVGGQVPRTEGPFAQAVLVNAGGNKLDAYLHQAIDYTVTSCGPKAREVTVSVKLTNKAPRSGLPPYVADWTSGKPSSPGADLVDLQVLLAHSADVKSASLDGEVVQLAPKIGALPRSLAGRRTQILDQGVQVGRPSYGLHVEVPAGASRTLTLHATEPASKAAPLLPVQTLVNPVSVTSDISACD